MRDDLRTFFGFFFLTPMDHLQENLIMRKDLDLAAVVFSSVPVNLYALPSFEVKKCDISMQFFAASFMHSRAALTLSVN